MNIIDTEINNRIQWDLDLGKENKKINNNENRNKIINKNTNKNIKKNKDSKNNVNKNVDTNNDVKSAEIRSQTLQLLTLYYLICPVKSTDLNTTQKIRKTRTIICSVIYKIYMIFISLKLKSTIFYTKLIEYKCK